MLTVKGLRSLRFQENMYIVLDAWQSVPWARPERSPTIGVIWRIWLNINSWQSRAAEHVTRRPAFIIYAGFGSSDVTWTLIPWSSWCPPSSSVDSTTVTLFYTGYLNLPSALCNECRTPLRGSHLVCHRVIMSVRRWRSCTGCQSLRRQKIRLYPQT